MSNKKGSYQGHFLMIFIGCLIMFGGLFLLGRGGSNNWAFLLILLCPLMHIFMMRGHMSHGKQEEDGENHQHHLKDASDQSEV